MLYLEDYLEMIEHLPQELRDRFTEMREMDLSVQNVMDSLEKRVRMFFSQCRRNEIAPGQADGEFGHLRRDYYKVLEDADEKVHLASQMYDLVERYLRRLDSELYKFKCELEADHNGITEILEKRSLELDGNSNSNSLMNNILHPTSTTTNNSQKENRYFGSISRESNSNSVSNSLSSSSLRESSANSHRYNRHKAEKRRDSNNGPSSIGAPPEKRQMLSSSASSQLATVNHNSISGSGAIAGSVVLAGNTLQSNNINSISPMVTSRVSGQTLNVHYNQGAHHHATTNHQASAGLSQNLNIQSGSISHGSSNAVIVTTTLGTGPNAVPIGATYTAECEVMRAASQAIAMTHQMQQGRRTASLKASVEAATSGGAAGGSGQDYLGRELVGATHNAIQAVERESFNSNQRRHKKKISSMGSSMGSSTSSAVQLPSLESSSSVSGGVRVDDNGMIVESTPEGEWTYDPNEPRYCICNQVSYGDMVACDNDVCPFEWFHYPCVGITQSPKGKWYCPQCTSSMKRRGSRKT